MQDYSYLQTHWKDLLVKHSAPHVSLKNMHLSDNLKKLLSELGLPLINNTINQQHFLPFTFFTLQEVKGKQLYLIGDISPKFMGMSFIGIELYTETIYQIWINGEHEYDYFFVNQSLFQFLQCLALYNQFMAKYAQSDTIVKEEIRIDYQKLQNDIDAIDNKARQEKDYFWKLNIELLEVNGYGDYLFDNSYDDEENSEDLPGQAEVNKKDLPF